MSRGMNGLSKKVKPTSKQNAKPVIFMLFGLKSLNKNDTKNPYRII